MASLDRRNFLKATVAGLASQSLARGAVSPDEEDPLGVRSEFPVTKTQTYLNSAYVGPIPKAVRKAAVEFADERMLRFRSFQRSWKDKNRKPQDRSSYPSVRPKPLWGTFPPRDERLF